MAKTVKEPEAEEAPVKKAERKPERKPAEERKAASKGPRKPELVLKVRYRRTMRPHRTYPLTLEAPRSKDERPAPLVIVRAIVPGALVSPAEQRMDLAKKGEKITFHITPLSRGALPRARLEIFAPGQPVQELRLPMRTTTQRKTWVLLALTALIPWGLTRMVWGPNRLDTYRIRPAIEGLKGDGDHSAPLKGINLISQPWPDAPDFLKDIVVLDQIAEFAGTSYTMLFDWLEKDNGVAWIFLGLFILTLLSWVWHRCWRGGRKLYFPLPEKSEESGSPATLAPLS